MNESKSRQWQKNPQTCVSSGGARRRLRLRIGPGGEDANGNMVSGSIEEETRHAQNWSRVLAEAGCELTDVVK
jgi:enamine deaminase RidA (YjgF/YER057c/UK114 family)